MTVEAEKILVSSKYSSFWYNCDWYMVGLATLFRHAFGGTTYRFSASFSIPAL
ncbi:hypothetical protein M378DRAFT_169151, partial [Amanita muscaria Koide BX008]